jgi:hypothetical protein
MDEDPTTVKPQYFENLKLSSEEHEICLYQDHVRNHRVIVLRPRLEEWLIKTTELCGIAMAEFGLSDRGNELHREINSRISNLEKLLEHLINKQDRRLTYLQKSLGL